MTVANKGFESSGQKPGQPEGWAVTTNVTTEKMASFACPGGNLALWSEQLQNAAWVGTNATVAADAETPPSGLADVDDTASTADHLVDDATNGRHSLTQTITPTHPDVTGRLNFSVYARQLAQPLLLVDVAGVLAWFDLSAGTVGPSTSGPADMVVAIEDAGGGWYRCSIAVTTTYGATSPISYELGSADTEGVATYVGPGSAAIALFGTQAALGGALPTYVTTTSAASLVETGAEDFDKLWAFVDDYLFALDPVATEQAQVTRPAAQTIPKFVEDFEELWGSNESYLFALGATVAADYDTALDDFEDFEEEWLSNEAYLFAFVGEGTDLDPADFDDAQGGTETHDSFEVGWGVTEEAFAGADHPNNEFDWALGPGPLLVEDEPFMFINQGGQTLPAGLSFAPTVYFAGNPNKTDFQVRATPLAIPINFTDNGTGGPFVVRRVGGNFTHLTALGADADHDFALYDTGMDPYEDFETEWPNVVMSTV